MAQTISLYDSDAVVSLDRHPDPEDAVHNVWVNKMHVGHTIEIYLDKPDRTEETQRLRITKEDAIELATQLLEVARQVDDRK